MSGQLRRIFEIKVNRLMAAVCAVCVALFLVVGFVLVGVAGYPPMILVTTIGFAIIAPVLVAAYIFPMSRAYLTDMDHMLAGQAWAHWHYDAAAWTVALGSKQAARGGQSSGGDVYITPLGIYAQPGGYTPLFSAGLRLREVELDESRAPRLHFRGETHNARSGVSLPADIFSLAVPRGQEAEARELVARFKSEILSKA